MQEAKLVGTIMPAYPPLAKQARVQGTVRLNAVQQWVCQPTTLNGEPVEVITEIDVNFTLAQ